jgi:hypothetical protein
VKIWIGFLLLAFFLGGREVRLQRPTRMLVIFGLSVAVTLALRSYRFV